MNDTLTTENGRSVLRIRRHLAHPPAKVWRAISEPEHLAHWFSSAVHIEELRPDAKLTFTGDGPASDGVITEVDPPRVLAFTWQDDHLRWELRPDGDGCLLTLTHTFDDRAGAASFASGWHTCVEALDAWLDGRTTELPRTMEQMAELHESFVAAFGLDQGNVDTTPDGWQVRFERQLTRPVDAVWSLLAGESEPTPGGPPPSGFRVDAIPAAQVTSVDPPTLLEYDWQGPDGRPAGHVRWHLANGTGNGARLTLTQAGPPDLAAAQHTALTAWRDHIAHLAAHVATGA